MAEKGQAKNNGKIAAICGAIAAVAVVVVIVVAALMMSGGSKLNDAYFVSDDAKYVLSLTADEMGLDVDAEDEEYVPVKAHIVYDYAGDKITGMRMYYEYADAARAKNAYDFMMEDETNTEGYKEVVLDGKYLIIVSNESDYEDLSAEDVKQQIELMELFRNLNLDEEE